MTPTDEQVERAALTDALDNYARLIDACGIRDENPHAISAAKARAAIMALESRERVLEAELAKLRTPEWFYNADDGEYSYGDVSDTVDDMGHEGVMRVGGAREVWNKWAAVRCVALDDDGDIDETEVVTFDTEDEALRCWPESLANARRALAGDAP